MAKLAIKAGATSVLVRIFLADSSSTTGAGLTGLTSGTSNFVCYRARDDDGNAGGTAISLSGGTRGTWSSGGFVEKDSTNMPGIYEFGIPDNALAAGSRSVLIMFKGATNLAPCPLEIDLDAQVDVTFWNGTVVASPATAGIPDVNAKNINNVATTSVATINANLGQTQPVNFTGTGASALVKTDMIDVNSVAYGSSTLNTLASHDPGATIGTGTSTLTQTQVSGGAYALNSASFAFNAALDFTTTQKAATLARVSLVDVLTTYTSNTPQTGDSFARIGATGSGLTSLAPSATALSTVQWTNTLATNLSTTNTTVASNLNDTITSRMATYTQPTGFLAATFPTTVASTTNITAATGCVLSTAGAQAAADALLARNVAGGSSSGRIVSEALYVLRNKVDMTNGTVYAVDDSTPSWTFAATTDVAALPITILDPV